ncbi:MAG: hydroxymethylbilane synthase [Candidatus Marinimicrobia bacterium]|nr:hydroxymethylbilane synthase [Candidatus Neomarinimicrobiota bacterium]
MNKLIIGTRGSALALKQAYQVRNLLQSVHSHLRVEIKTIQSLGDDQQETPLPEIGAKGLFTAEIESELLSQKIDLAVHSLKDLPSTLPNGLKYVGSPKREDARDVFISHKWRSLSDVPAKSIIATGSARRKAQFLEARSDLEFRNLRGNIETRLNKLKTEGWDGIIMAAAALHRLNMSDQITRYMDPLQFVPAVGQGAIGLELKLGREEVEKLVASIIDPETTQCCQAERLFLARLEGGCSTAIGCWGRIENRRFIITGYAASSSGSKVIRKYLKGMPADSTQLAQQLSEEFEHAGAKSLLAE